MQTNMSHMTEIAEE